MPILTRKHCRIATEPSDGTRILVMRYWPRGCRKDQYDTWYRELAPSPHILGWIKEQEGAGKLSADEIGTTWREKYVREMQEQSDLIEELRTRHKSGETLTLLCACHDENQCHRQVLRDLVLEKPDSEYRADQLSLFNQAPNIANN